MSLSALGIDPANLARQYTQFDRAAKDENLSNKSTAFNSQISAFTKLQTDLTSFNTSLSDNLDVDSTFLANSATVNNADAVSVTTTGKATAGEYDVFVEQLAQAHQVALKFDPTIDLSTDGSLDIDLAGSAFTVDLASLNANPTLSDLASAINADVNNTGVKASVIRSGTETFLMFTSEESGAANQVSLSFTAGTDPNGSNVTSAITGQTELTTAQDAIVKLGTTSPITITSQSNTLDTQIAGVTLNLTKVQAAGDSPVHISVKQDKDATVKNIQGFVDAFNNLTKTISDNDDLKRDSLSSSLRSGLRNDFQGTFEGKTLYSVGIEFDNDGSLKIDSKRLEAALTSDPDLLNKMLTGSNGIMAKLEDRVEPYTKTSGLITSKKQTLQASLDIVTKKQESHDMAMDNLYQRYLSQFTQMQQTIAQLESTMGQFG